MNIENTDKTDVYVYVCAVNILYFKDSVFAYQQRDRKLSVEYVCAWWGVSGGWVGASAL